MSQHEERARAILKVRKLVDQTTDRGRTESEADMAMDQLSKLMTAFNITMDEVHLSGEACKQVVCDTFQTTRGPLDSIVVSLAHFCDCKAWFHRQRGKLMYSKKDPTRVLRDTNGSRLREKGNTTYNFFGLESDADMASYLFEMIRSAMQTETENFKKCDYYLNYPNKQAKKTLTYNFQEGFCRRIRFRLDELKAESDALVEEARVVGSTDLMVVKRHKVEEDFKKQLGFKLGSGTSRGNGASIDSNARLAGAAAGEGINLSRPISTGNNSSTRLLSNA